jgi:LuxR family quorum-sensing transcriptional regulator LasR
MNHFEKLSGLLECRTEQAWRDTVFKLGNDLGFDQTLLAIFPDRDAPIEATHAFLHSNYSARWRSKYDDEALGYVDPTVTHCLTKTTPLVWSPELFSTQRQQEMYEEACSYNLRSGLTLPIHGPNGEVGILCFVSDNKADKEFKRHAFEKLPEVTLLRDFIFESSTQFRRQSVIPQIERPELTRCELECLKWSAVGKTSWETAKILTCTEATVNFHFSNIRRKMNVTSRRQAVVKAIRLGLISPA